MQITVTNEETLLEFLTRHFPDSSKTTIRSWIEQGRINIEGSVLKKSSHLLQVGNTVEVAKRVLFINGSVQILFQDPHLVVVNKPEGMLTVDTDMVKNHSLHSLLKRHFYPRRIFPVHRLDRETSGILVFAFKEQTKEGLKDLFSTHDIEREYIAIVEGRLPEKKGTWETYLKEDKNFFVHVAASEKEGELAITHFRVIGQNAKYTALLLNLETGKKNQIRVQCAHTGVPIAGDKKYGAKTSPIGRVCLHARQLSFIHPITNRRHSFHVPFPESFNKVVDLLGTV